jgi:hypothetical protein
MSCRFEIGHGAQVPLMTKNHINAQGSQVGFRV